MTTESNKPLTPFQFQMQLHGVSMRELAGLSGESTALICYIARGLAHFPTYAQLERCARYMGCTPSDLYTKAQLRMMYPEQFPKKKRKSDGNPRVRIDKTVYEYLDARAGEMRIETNYAINSLLKHAVDSDKMVLCDVFDVKPSELMRYLNGSNNDGTWWSPSQEASNDAAGT